MQINAYNVPGTSYVQSYRSSGAPWGNPSVQIMGTDIAKRGTCSPVVKGNHRLANPWSYNIETWASVKGSSVLYGPGWFERREGILPNMNAMLALANYANASDPYNKALAKLYEKIRSDTDLSIDIYQGGQTVKMLTGFAKAIANPTRTLAKTLGGLVSSGKIKRGSSLISNKWLEWQYGIRPTVSTIQTLMSDLHDVLSDENGVFHIKARAQNLVTTKVDVDKQPLSSIFPSTVTCMDSRRCEFQISYTIGNAELNSLSQFTSLNPVSFIYENIPFSFVLDWIVDVSGYLRMVETALLSGLQFKRGYVTTSRRISAKCHVDAVTSQGGYPLIGKGDGWYEARSLNRVLLGSLPLPQAPSLNIHLGSQRLLSAASLLRGFIR